MPDITIKEVPERIYRKLERRARAQHRSVESEAKVRLESTLVEVEDDVDVEGLLARARRNRERMSVFITDDLLRQFKEEGRK
jgi:plasmid stability protein